MLAPTRFQPGLRLEAGATGVRSPLLGAIIAAALFVCGADSAQAVPVFPSAEAIEGVQVFRDDKSRSLFYYAPGKLAIPKNADGHPEISFLQTRYLGTSATGDKGQFRTRSILSFRVRMESFTAERLDAVRAKLRERSRVGTLRPLPIRRIETTLNYTPLKGEGTESKPAGSGALEAAGKPGDAAPRDGYWTERVYTLAPDDLTSQALWEAMKSGKVLLSLSYSFHADGIAAGDLDPKTSGNVKVDGVGGGAAGKVGPHTVFSEVVGVTVDAASIPDCLRRVDLNEQVPANYAALAVYCYDFNNALRPDLEEKSVEIQAVSVTGSPVVQEVRFSRATPDLPSAQARFRFAVSLKEPYRYRVREITTEGEERIGPWRDGKPWTQILDVTTPAGELPKPAPAADGEDGKGEG